MLHHLVESGGFVVQKQRYCDNTGRDEELAMVRGLINGGDQLQLFLEMYIPKHFPEVPPIVYVIPPQGVRLNAVNYILEDGQVDLR